MSKPHAESNWEVLTFSVEKNIHGGKQTNTWQKKYTVKFSYLAAVTLSVMAEARSVPCQALSWRQGM